MSDVFRHSIISFNKREKMVFEITLRENTNTVDFFFVSMESFFSVKSILGI